ncbi:uncharacterized protein LOC112589735 isoform X2 [Harpegnathos saltator]|uniref:uncharacterized protein LOC112589735 isoform X2 n=1 Tax=Harpegnathos saltator TaxID=610380 RepID=UPI000DBEE0F7|nr:uncharacterized protein LOC112589735 isoform X2 [Harpegnathos saltator]
MTTCPYGRVRGNVEVRHCFYSRWSQQPGNVAVVTYAGSLTTRGKDTNASQVRPDICGSQEYITRGRIDIKVEFAGLRLALDEGSAMTYLATCRIRDSSIRYSYDITIEQIKREQRRSCSAAKSCCCVSSIGIWRKSGIARGTIVNGVVGTLHILQRCSLPTVERAVVDRARRELVESGCGF